MVTIFIYAQEKHKKNSNNDVVNENVISEKMYIDIRTSEEFSEGTIPHALNIDYYAEDFNEKTRNLIKIKN